MVKKNLRWGSEMVGVRSLFIMLYVRYLDSHFGWPIHCITIFGESEKVECTQIFFSHFRVEGIACHVAKQEDRDRLIEETLKQLGALDILVSNAGTNPAMGAMLDVRNVISLTIFEILF